MTSALVSRPSKVRYKSPRTAEAIRLQYSREPDENQERCANIMAEESNESAGIEFPGSNLDLFKFPPKFAQIPRVELSDVTYLNTGHPDYPAYLDDFRRATNISNDPASSSPIRNSVPILQAASDTERMADCSPELQIAHHILSVTHDPKEIERLVDMVCDAIVALHAVEYDGAI